MSAPKRRRTCDRDTAMALLDAVLSGDCLTTSERNDVIRTAYHALGAPDSPGDCTVCGEATMAPCVDCEASEDPWAECPLDYNWADYAGVDRDGELVCVSCDQKHLIRRMHWAGGDVRNWHAIENWMDGGASLGTEEDVAHWFAVLVRQDLDGHPDDGFDGYDGLSPAQAAEGDRLMAQAFGLVRCVYTLMMGLRGPEWNPKGVA